MRRRVRVGVLILATVALASASSARGQEAHSQIERLGQGRRVLLLGERVDGAQLREERGHEALEKRRHHAAFE